MNLTWHIVRKDFRRMRWPLAAWLALPLVEWALIARSSGAAIEPVAVEGMRTMAAVWTGLTWFGGLILAAWLVMEDGLVGTQAGWQTRPISGGRLLAAKALAAFLMFLVLPALVMTPAWLAAGFSWHDLAWCAVEVALKQLIFSAMGIAIAAVSQTAGQLFVRLVIATVAVPVAMGYCAGIFDSSIMFDGDGLAETRYRIVMSVFVLVPLLMILHQYLTRRTRRTYLILAAGIVAILALRWGWTWDLSGAVRHFPTADATRNPGITFAAEPLALQAGEVARAMVARGTILGEPAGSYVDFREGRGWWTDASGRRPGEKFLPKMEAPLERAALEVAGGTPKRGTPAAWRLSTAVRDERLARTVATSPRLELVAKAVLMRGRVFGDLPLRTGATVDTGSIRLRVTDVERQDDHLVVSVEQRLPWPPWSARAQDTFLLGHGAEPSGVTYLGTGGERAVVFNGIAYQLRQFSVPIPTQEVNGHVTEIAGWEEAARLVVVHFTPDVWFSPIVLDQADVKLASATATNSP